jgi:L-fucose isomerase-like protein
LHRRKIPFIFAGIVFPEEKRFVESIRGFARVCAVVNGFIGINVGLVGPRPERFETCIFSEDALMKKFKQRVVPVSLLNIVDQASKVNNDDPELQKIVQDMKKEIDLSGITGEIAIKLAKLELVLKRFAEEKHLSGMGLQCWTAIQKVYGVSPCYVMGRLTDRGIMTACEVDIYGALTMLVQYLASLKTTAPHFVDWTIRHQEKENVFLAWHCGNAPPSLVCEGCPAVLRYHSILGETLGIENQWARQSFSLSLDL